MHTPAVSITVGWILALIALLLALAMLFVPTVVPLNHITAGVGIGLVAASRLIP